MLSATQVTGAIVVEDDDPTALHPFATVKCSSPTTCMGIDFTPETGEALRDVDEAHEFMPAPRKLEFMPAPRKLEFMPAPRKLEFMPAPRKLDCLPAEVQAIAEMRAAVGAIDDFTALRFLRARRLHVGRASEMYAEYVEWRRLERIDECASDPPLPPEQEAALSACFSPRVLDAPDKLGRPVFLVCAGEVNLPYLRSHGVTQGHTWCTPTPCTFPSVHC